MSHYTFAVLAPTHNVGAFSCGHAEIDDYLHNRATQEQATGLCQVYVVADAAHRVWAYGTLSPLSLRVDTNLLKAVGMIQSPYVQVGGYLLGRLGTDQTIQRGGMGASVVTRLSKIAAQMRDVTGGVFLAVDPKEDWLVSWYQKLGFSRLSPDPTRRKMVLPLASVP